MGEITSRQPQESRRAIQRMAAESRLYRGVGPQTGLEVAQNSDEKCERAQNYHREPEIG